MTLTTLGDSAHLFSQSLQNFRLKTELNTLTATLSTGEVQDKTKAMNGDTFQFTAIEHRLSIATTRVVHTVETGTRLASMQRTLDTITTQSGTLAESLITINQDATQLQIDIGAARALQTFENTVNAFNVQFAGQSLFAGTAVDQPALASPTDMLNDLVTSIGAATDAPTIQAAVANWFDDPTGGFSTIGYLGDTGDPVTRRLDDGTVITINTRADNPELKAVLKAAATAAITSQLSSISRQDQASLLFTGGVMLQATATDVATTQGALGVLEAEVERITVAQNAEISALTLARNEIANADPFETASALQAVQLQLETHYQMTARLSQLSLVNFI